MFSGIVEEYAEVVRIVKEQENLHLTLKCSFVDELKIDQSISHNGVCLTVVSLQDGTYTVTAMKETIENNVDLPSLAPLIKIARALGVRLGTFLDDQEEQGAVICRKQESEDTISFSNNAMDLRTHMRYHSLSKSKADRHMEPFIVDVEPTEESHFSLSSHEGEEFIYVMEGAVEVCHGKKCHLIKAGDSIYYDSIVPHHVHGYQGQAAKILAVIYTPI